MWGGGVVGRGGGGAGRGAAPVGGGESWQGAWWGGAGAGRGLFLLQWGEGHPLPSLTSVHQDIFASMLAFICLAPKLEPTHASVGVNRA